MYSQIGSDMVTKLRHLQIIADHLICRLDWLDSTRLLRRSGGNTVYGTHSPC